MSINIAIVDGDRGTLDGLASLIRATPGLHLGAACRSGRAALSELPVVFPQVVLLEPNLNDLPAFSLIPRLRAAIPGVAIVVLSRELAGRTVQMAIASGACGLLALDSPPLRIIQAVFEVVQGGAPLDPRAARMLVERLHTDLADGAATEELSRREEEVLRGYMRGLRAKEVATWLNISIFTVQTHVRNIYSKLGAHSIAHAVAIYLLLGRLTNPSFGPASASAPPGVAAAPPDSSVASKP